MSMTVCRGCGQAVAAGLHFCGNCGLAAAAIPVAATPIAATPIAATPIAGTPIGAVIAPVLEPAAPTAQLDPVQPSPGVWTGPGSNTVQPAPEYAPRYPDTAPLKPQASPGRKLAL